MKLEEEMETGHFWLKNIIAVVCMATAMMFGCRAGVLPASEVFAATEKTAEKVPAIYFTDKSGKYLTKVKNQWYLKDQDGKALTGIQYLKIAKTEGLLT